MVACVCLTSINSLVRCLATMQSFGLRTPRVIAPALGIGCQQHTLSQDKLLKWSIFQTAIKEASIFLKRRTLHIKMYMPNRREYISLQAWWVKTEVSTSHLFHLPSPRRKGMHGDYPHKVIRKAFPYHEVIMLWNLMVHTLESVLLITNFFVIVESGISYWCVPSSFPNAHMTQ